MNIFALLSLVSAISIFSLGILIFSKNPKEEINKLFMLICIFTAINSFTEFEMRQADNFNTAFFWFTISNVFPIIFFLLLHYCLIFSEKFKIKRKKIQFLLSYYIFAIFNIFIAFIVVILGRVPKKKYWGWSASFPSEPILINLLLIVLIMQFILFFFSLYVTLSVYFNPPNYLKKKQAKFISIGISIPLIIYFLIDLLFTIISFINIPEMVSIGIVIAVFFLGYSMWKYELFSLDLSTTARKIFSTISDCLILTNPEEKILSINKVLSDLLNYQENELIEKPFTFLLASEQDFKLFNYQLQLLTSEENGEFLTDVEIDFKTKANEKIRISLTASKISDKLGNLQGIIYIGRNITKTKKIEKQLDEAIKMSQFKSKFMASMSHELRTPLNAIMGFVELLLEDYCGPLNKCQTKFLTDVNLSSKDLLELINRLLDLSKIEAGKLELDINDIKIKFLLDHIETILKPLCIKKNLNFNIENFTTSEFVRADFIRLKEILFNLLDNAIKFTQKGGITLKIKEQIDCFEFSVFDTGIGIAESDFNNIFGEFKKIKNPEIKNTQGMGLGLAITKYLVILHKGNISFSSELGKGSTFTFTIPKENIANGKELN